MFKFIFLSMSAVVMTQVMNCEGCVHVIDNNGRYIVDQHGCVQMPSYDH
jgi:hypothetical protein